MHAFIQDAAVGDGIGRVAGHKQTFQHRFDGTESVSQMPTVHFRHHYVRNQQVNVVRIGLDLMQGFRRGTGSFFGKPAQINPEGCPFSRLAVDVDKAFILLYDAITVASPRPVPLPCSFVEKKGSKILARVSLSMPQPLSLTSSKTNSPGINPR